MNATKPKFVVQPIANAWVSCFSFEFTFVNVMKNMYSGCRNVVETFNGQLGFLESTQIQATVKIEPTHSTANRKRSMDQHEPTMLPAASATTAANSSSGKIPAKKPCNFMTQDVIEATVQCIMSQAEDCQQQKMDKTLSEKMILEEFGRCLVEIIEFSLKNNDN